MHDIVRLRSRFLLVWALALPAIGAWLWFNLRVLITPTWLDLLCWSGLVIALANVIRPALHSPALPFRVKLAGWLLLIPALLFAIRYLASAPAPYDQRSALWSTQAKLSILTLFRTSSPWWLYNDVYLAERGLAQIPLLSAGRLVLLVCWLGLGIAVAAIAACLVMKTVEPHLKSHEIPFRMFRFARHVRLGRWEGRIVRSAAIVGILALLALGVAGIANRRAVPLEHRQTLSATPPILPASVRSVVVDHTGDSPTVYAGALGGVFRLASGDQTWQKAGLGLFDTNVQHLLLDQQTGALFAATSRGVYHTDAGADNWSFSGLERYEICCLARMPGKGLYAGSVTGEIFLLPDNGSEWQLVTRTYTALAALAVDPRRGTLYAGLLFSGFGMPWNKGVIESSDGGNYWRSAAGLEGYATTALLWDDSRDALYAGTDRGVFRSAGKVRSWSPIGDFLCDVRALAQDPSTGELFAAACDAGVFRWSETDPYWRQAGAVLEDSRVFGLTVDAGDRTLYAAMRSGVAVLDPQAHRWRSVGDGPANYSVTAATLDPSTHSIYASTLYGGVFRSDDEGRLWLPASDGIHNPAVTSLAFDPKRGTLFAGTRGGIFLSINGGLAWQRANQGLNNPDIRVLAVDAPRNRIFAGARDGLYISRDQGWTWQKAWSNLDVLALGIREADGLLYLASSEGGVYRFSDAEQSWELSSAGLGRRVVTSLLIDQANGFVYGGTAEGLFLSTDSGDHWFDTPLGFLPVQALGMNQTAGTVYAATPVGVFAHDRSGETWRPRSEGLGDSEIWSLTVDEAEHVVYASAAGGLYRLLEGGGAAWTPVQQGLSNARIRTVLWPAPDGALYAGLFYGGVQRSIDGGRTWQKWNTGLDGRDIVQLSASAPSGVLYAVTDTGTYRREPGAGAWEPVDDSKGLLDLALAPGSYGILGRTQEGQYLWASHNGGAVGSWLARTLHMAQADLQPLPNGGAVVQFPWGTTVTRTELDPAYDRSPAVWLAVRFIALKLERWLTTSWYWLRWALLAIVVILITLVYSNFARPWKVPVWAVFLAPAHLADYASPDRLDTAWPSWEVMIRNELLTFGDVRSADLRKVPRPFRQYALDRFIRTYGDRWSLIAGSAQIQLQNADRLVEWQRLWFSVTAKLKKQRTLDAVGWHMVDEIVDLLCKQVGMERGEARPFDAARIYPVRAPVVRLKVPASFPLVIVADRVADQAGAKAIADAAEMGEKGGYFGVVVPLAPTQESNKLALTLRGQLKDLPRVPNLIVLGADDLHEIILAPHAKQIFERKIAAQADLRVLNPFVTTGPVTHPMFFGRKSELRMLVDNPAAQSFAIVGNRRIGKTSLMRKAASDLETVHHVQLRLIDCGIPGNAEGASALIDQGGLSAVLVDEVDLLLALPGGHGEQLLSAWRAFANQRRCRFVLAGGALLAQKLRDPMSALFNFAQPITLGYLPQDEAAAVVVDPLDNLGIEIEDRERLVDEIMGLTSGHPNLIQYVGHNLVSALNQRSNRRIMMSDLIALRNSHEFRRYFLDAVWGAVQTEPLAQLITLVAPGVDFSREELLASLGARRIRTSDNRLARALELLQLYAILEVRGPVYSFIPRAFHQILHESSDVEGLTVQALELVSREDCHE